MEKSPLTEAEMELIPNAITMLSHTYYKKYNP